MDSIDQNLIELVQSYPCLYRSKDKSYKSLAVKENCWNEIGRKLKRKPEECKTKWRNIRDNYKKIQKKKKSGSVEFVSKYDDERLKFIDDSYDEEEVIITGIKTEIDKRNDEDDSPEEDDQTTSSTHISSCDPLSLHRSQEPSQSQHWISQVRKRNSLAEGIRRNRIMKRRKLLRQNTERGDTPVHVFFKSMADVVCQFPPDKIAQIRSKVCNIVSDMELSILEHDT